MNQRKQDKRHFFILFAILLLFSFLTACSVRSEKRRVDAPESTGNIVGPSVVEVTGTSATSPVPTGIPIIKNPFSGTLSYQGQKDEYYYTAPITGDYRFSFDTSDATANYNFVLLSAKNESMAERSYSNSERGITVALNAKETYRIYVEQQEGFPTYKISIGVPRGPAAVKGTFISQTFQFQDQQDRYSFKAPKSGIYRFDFEINDVTMDYTFFMLSSKKENIAERSYSSGEHGVTVELQKNETYQIIVKQKDGLSTYSVRIGIPQDETTLKAPVVHGSFRFKDQQNVYYYTPSGTGTYQFHFLSSDETANYYIRVYDSKNASCMDSQFDHYGHMAEADLQAGQKYKIILLQQSKLPTYTVTITKKASTTA